MCGFSVERVEKDYGYDLILFTYDKNRELENGQIYVQAKATEKAKHLKRTSNISFTLEKSHLATWLSEPMPVILTLYDVSQDKAYWLYLQSFFEVTRPKIRGEKRLSVHLSENNLVSIESVERWSYYKSLVLDQLDGVIKHNV